MINLKQTLQVMLLVVAGIGTAGLGASTFVAMSADELIEQSAAIVQGRVIRTNARWNDQGNMVVTDATVVVTDPIVGDPGAELIVQLPGGQVGDFLVEAHGFPQLSRGQEVILFLSQDPTTGTSRIVGHSQGHFEVVERLDGVTLAVPQMEDGVSFLTPSGQPLPPPASAELGVFKNSVRAQAARAGKPVRQ